MPPGHAVVDLAGSSVMIDAQTPLEPAKRFEARLEGDSDGEGLAQWVDDPQCPVQVELELVETLDNPFKDLAQTES